MRCSNLYQSTFESNAEPPVQIQHDWKLSPNDHIKVNCDAAIGPTKSSIGLGMVARNSREDFMGVRCMVIFQRTKARMAEAMAALWAVKFCKEVGFFEVILEGDAAQVVNGIISPLPHLAKSGHLTESIIQELQGFKSAIFVHVKRECNNVAHTLARLAVDQNFSDVLLEEPPNCIVDLIVRERLCL
jgi:ribonuclease HI